MSVEEIKRFNTDVNQDEALKEAVKKVGADVGALVVLAKDKGYDFTAEELQTLADSKQGELSEEQLDGVAGGGTTATHSNVVVIETVVVVV